jgi:hypothetical protein
MTEASQQGSLRRLFALLKALGLQGADERGALALQYSSGRTGQISGLSAAERENLIGDLAKQAQAPAKKAPSPMRSKVLHLATRAGLLPAAHGRHLRRSEYDRFNDWMLAYAVIKKPLWDYADKELPALISQLERVAAWREDKEAGEAVRALIGEMGIGMESDIKQQKKRKNER